MEVNLTEHSFKYGILQENCDARFHDAKKGCNATNVNPTFIGLVLFGDLMHLILSEDMVSIGYHEIAIVANFPL